MELNKLQRNNYRRTVSGSIIIHWISAYYPCYFSLVFQSWAVRENMVSGYKISLTLLHVTIARLLGVVCTVQRALLTRRTGSGHVQISVGWDLHATFRNAQSWGTPPPRTCLCEGFLHQWSDTYMQIPWVATLKQRKTGLAFDRITGT